MNQKQSIIFEILPDFKNEDIIKAKNYIKKYNFNINKQDSDGTNLFMIASQYGDNSIIDMYLKYNNKNSIYIFDINHKNKNGDTALIFASNAGNTKIVKKLLKNGAKVNLSNFHGCTAIMYASKIKIFNLLLEYNANTNKQSNDGLTILINASFKGNLEIVKCLLDNEEYQKTNNNLQNKDGYTALMGASMKGHLKIVKHLLKFKVDINIKDKNGATSLMWASQKGHSNIVKYILEYNIILNKIYQNKISTIDLQDKKGYTALILASENKNHEVIDLLLKYNANVELKNNDGETALMWATLTRDFDMTIIKKLLKINNEEEITEDIYTTLCDQRLIMMKRHLRARLPTVSEYVNIMSKHSKECINLNEF